MSASVGAALKAAREKRNLSLAQVSEITRVRSHYLQALENDDVSAMPSAAQARGFLRLYAEYLGLDLAELIPPPAPAQEIPAASEPPREEKPESPREPPKPPLATSLSKAVADFRQRLASRIAPKPDLSSGDANPSAGAPPSKSSPELLEPETPAPDKKKMS